MSWIDASRYVLDHGFVIVEDDGSWHPPTEENWRALEPEDFEDTDEDPIGDSSGVLLDAFTASMLVQVHDALGEENQARFVAMPVTRAVTVGWKLVERARR